MGMITETERDAARIALAHAVELHGRNREDLTDCVLHTAREFYAFLTNPNVNAES